MRDFRKYKVWELGHQVTLDMYRLSMEFPHEEIYGITGQMRRAAYSIPSNIAEGCGRESDAEFKRFLTISQGSASELEYFTILAKDLGYLAKSDFLFLNNNVNKTKRSLNSLIQKI
ncbi:MAG: four helix bundle protein [Bacteroidota bacterium]